MADSGKCGRSCHMWQILPHFLGDSHFCIFSMRKPKTGARYATSPTFFFYFFSIQLYITTSFFL